MAKQDFNSPDAKTVHRHLIYKPGYVAKYKKSGEYILHWPCESGPLNTVHWHEARVMDTQAKRHYEHCLGEFLDLIRVKD